MLKHWVAALRHRLGQRRRYAAMVAELARINAADLDSMDWLCRADHGGHRQVLGGGRR